jgi:hypothetical protein
MKQTGAYNVNDNKLIVKFVSTRDGRCTLLKEFKLVTRVRFIKNGDHSTLYCMELFQNSPGGVKLRIDDEFLHFYRIVNTQKRFRFHETDIILRPQKWKDLKWEWQKEEDGSLTASNANPYIIKP